MPLAPIDIIRFCRYTLLITVTLFATSVSAHNKVVVIPMLGHATKPLKNVVTVAKANGDYSDPVAALAGIIDASASNPYLIVIAPGVYTVTSALVMKPWVDIAGSGQEVTFIKGPISSTSADATSAIISGMNAAELSDLTVENTGGNSFSIAIFNYYSSVRLMRVTAIAGGGTINYGIYNRPNSSPTMTQLTVTASGGTSNYGIYNNHYSSPTMTQVTVTASGGTDNNYGIYNLDHCQSSMMMVTATASGGTGDNYGVYNWDTTAAPFIENSFLKGTTSGVRIGSDSTRIVNTRIEGGVSGDIGGTQCLGTYDQNLNNVGC